MNTFRDMGLTPLRNIVKPLGNQDSLKLSITPWKSLLLSLFGGFFQVWKCAKKNPGRSLSLLISIMGNLGTLILLIVIVPIGITVLFVGFLGNLIWNILRSTFVSI